MMERSRNLLPLVFSVGVASWIGLAVGAEPSTNKATADQTLGREIFHREWLPNDPRSHGGDGLGPVFNDSSCVGCHNLGGPGGGGPASKNVDIVSAFRNDPRQVQQQVAQPAVPAVPFASQLLGQLLSGQAPTVVGRPALTPEQRKARQEEMAKIHPGLRTARGVVLHRFGTDAQYDDWKWKLFTPEAVTTPAVPTSPASATEPTNVTSGNENSGEATVQGVIVLDSTLPLLNPITPARSTRSPDIVAGQMMFGLGLSISTPAGLHQARRTVHRGMAVNRGNVLLTVSQRNATSLFGAGLIDSIPDEVIEAAAQRKHDGFEEVHGRVARLKDGTIGRFGWKARKATLHDFTMTACAVELGLHVPEHPQSGSPTDSAYQPAGFDLNQDECHALVAYLKQLPAPIKQSATHPKEAEYLTRGEALFNKVGCGTCHVRELGDVDGLYSDLLVHNMGPELSDQGDYGVFIPESPGDDPSEDEPLPELTGQPKSPPKIVGAMQTEWRTPPLWGVRDSAPYLHDGRAGTLEEAVSFHGGEAQKSAALFFQLSSAERMQLLAFLKSLRAPEQVAAAQ